MKIIVTLILFFYLPLCGANIINRDLTIKDNVVIIEEKVALIEYIKDKYDTTSLADIIKIVDFAYYYSNNKNLPPTLILALIDIESGFKKNVKSSGGAIGVMQIIPYWHKEKWSHLKNKKDLWNIAHNIDVGTDIIKEYLDREKGNLKRGLQRYNGALNKKPTYANKVLSVEKKYIKVIESVAG